MPLYQRDQSKFTARDAALSALILGLLPFAAVYVVGAAVADRIERRHNVYKARRANLVASQRREGILKESIKNSPQPLPKLRKRNLSTLPLRTPPQGCHFLERLPPEIRQEIYHYVVGGSLNHVVRKGKHLAHVRCRLGGQSDFDRLCRPAARFPYWPQFENLCSTSNGNLALLRTCKQIYGESVEIMYKRNAFDFDHQDLFLLFVWSVLPQRLAQISRLHLTLDLALATKPFRGPKPAPNAWNLMWQVIGQEMLGLKYLYLRLIGEQSLPHPTTTQREQWMDPILDLRGLKSFHLDLSVASYNWPEYEHIVHRLGNSWEEVIRKTICSDRTSSNTQERSLQVRGYS
ncbi:MAG: hypothetical protein LQ352_007106 [Teloschistes flavicans]|nr:MAG: hypothetical protein LQ352_007106 [Teloschistes flavicans]